MPRRVGGAPRVGREEDDAKRILLDLISEEKWEEASRRCRDHPEDAVWRDEKVEDNSLPIHVACSKKKAPVSIFRLLLEAYPGGVEVEDGCGHLPLYRACQFKLSIQVIRFLHESFPGAVRRSDEYGFLPLHVSCRTKASMGRISVIRYLRDAYPEGATKPNKAGRLPIDLIQGEGDKMNRYREQVRRILGGPHPPASVRPRRVTRRHGGSMSASSSSSENDDENNSGFSPRVVAKDADDAAPSPEEAETGPTPPQGDDGSPIVQQDGDGGGDVATVRPDDGVSTATATAKASPHDLDDGGGAVPPVRNRHGDDGEAGTSHLDDSGGGMAPSADTKDGGESAATVHPDNDGETTAADSSTASPDNLEDEDVGAAVPGVRDDDPHDVYAAQKIVELRWRAARKRLEVDLKAAESDLVHVRLDDAVSRQLAARTRTELEEAERERAEARAAEGEARAEVERAEAVHGRARAKLREAVRVARGERAALREAQRLAKEARAAVARAERMHEDAVAEAEGRQVRRPVKRCRV